MTLPRAVYHACHSHVLICTRLNEVNSLCRVGREEGERRTISFSRSRSHLSELALLLWVSWPAGWPDCAVGGGEREAFFGQPVVYTPLNGQSRVGGGAGSRRTHFTGAVCAWQGEFGEVGTLGNCGGPAERQAPNVSLATASRTEAATHIVGESCAMRGASKWHIP